MRDLITGLAAVLFVVLAAAFIVPPFIDWESRRDDVAKQLSTALGRDVRIDGAIAISLLPTPAVKFGHVTLAGEGALQGTIGRVKAAAAAPALLRGQIRLTSIELDGAKLALSAMGSAAARPASPAEVAIERLQIRSSELVFVAADGSLAHAGDISGELDATALDGPWRGAVGFTHQGVRRMLRFSTGKAANGVMRLRALVENEAAAARIDYDGNVLFDGATPAIDGRLTASGNLDLALGDGRRNLLWRIETQLKGDQNRTVMDNLALAIGPAERQAVFAGNGEVALVRSMVSATLAARQIDMDRMLGGEADGASSGPEALLRHIGASLAGGAGALPTQLGGRLDVTIGSLIAGGGVVAGPRIVVIAEKGRLALREATGELPGRTMLSYKAEDENGGPLALETPDGPAFLGWLQQRPPQRGAVRRLAISGTAAFSSGELVVTDAELKADDMRFRGSLNIVSGPARPRVTARLLADRLDIARLPELDDRSGPSAFDLDLVLDAGRVNYNGVGAGSIRVNLLRDGAGVTIRDFAVRELGGATLQASGTLDRGFSVELDATRLEALLELLDRLSPHGALPLLKARAAALAPARLSLAAVSRVGGHWGLTVRGRLGDTDIEADVAMLPDGSLAGGEGVRATLRSPGVSGLARQLGLPAVAIANAGPVALSLSGGGLAGGPAVPWSLKGVVGGLSLDAGGNWKADPAESFAGHIRLGARDLFPLAQTMLIAVPRVPPATPLDLSAELDLRGYRITLRDMDAKLAGQPVKGEITFDLLQFGRISGQLRMPYFDPSVVAPIVFGEPQPSAAGAWSATGFGPPAAASLPGDLWLEVGEVPIAEGFVARDAGFVLRFDNGLLFLEHARGTVAGMRAEANGTFRRSGRNVSVAGQARLSGAVPGLASGADAAVDGTAIGESPAQLMSALSGSGTVRHRGLTLPGLRSDVFGEIATSSTGVGAASRLEMSRQLRSALTVPLSVPTAETRLSLAGGVIRIGPKRLDLGAVDVTASAAFDLRQRQLSARMTYASRQMPKDWSGAPPQAAFQWRGDPGALELDVEADDFANNLTAAAIRRETDRIEALEQDQRERSFFNRRFRASEDEKRAEEERQRAEQLARQRAEQQRLDRERLERERRELERRRAAEEAARLLPIPQSPAPPLQILPNTAR